MGLDFMALSSIPCRILFHILSLFSHGISYPCVYSGRGVVLLNCAAAMNTKGLAQDVWLLCNDFVCT